MENELIMDNETFEWLTDYVERVDKGTVKEINIEEKQRIHRFVEGLWKDLKYSPLEFSTFLQSVEFVLEADRSMVEALFQQIKIKMTTKDKKRGRSAFYKRMVMKYNKPYVRKYFQSMFLFLLKEEAQLLEDSVNLNDINGLKNDIGFEPLWWLSNVTTETKHAFEIINNNFKDDYIKMLIVFYFLYIKMEFEVIMDEPNKLRNNEQVANPQKILKENKNLKKQVDKGKKQESDLKKTIHHLNLEKKQLQGEIHELYRESLKEIEILKEQNENLLLTFEKEREMYIKIIQDLTEGNEKTEVIFNNDMDLQGKVICVIGGNRERHYLEIIEKYNGKINFVSEDNFNKIKGAVSESSVVFFLTELVGHHHFREALNYSKLTNKPFIFVNSKGLSSFERELVRFINKDNELIVV